MELDGLPQWDLFCKEDQTFAFDGDYQVFGDEHDSVLKSGVIAKGQVVVNKKRKPGFYVRVTPLESEVVNTKEGTKNRKRPRDESQDKNTDKSRDKNTNTRGMRRAPEEYGNPGVKRRRVGKKCVECAQLHGSASCPCSFRWPKRTSESIKSIKAAFREMKSSQERAKAACCSVGLAYVWNLLNFIDRNLDSLKALEQNAFDTSVAETAAKLRISRKNAPRKSDEQSPTTAGGEVGSQTEQQTKGGRGLRDGGKKKKRKGKRSRVSRGKVLGRALDLEKNTFRKRIRNTATAPLGCGGNCRKKKAKCGKCEGRLAKMIGAFEGLRKVIARCREKHCSNRQEPHGNDKAQQNENKINAAERRIAAEMENDLSLYSGLASWTISGKKRGREESAQSTNEMQDERKKICVNGASHCNGM